MTSRYKRHFFLDTPEGPLVTSAPTEQSVLPADFKSAALRSLRSTNTTAGQATTSSSPGAAYAGGQPALASVSKETAGPKLTFALVSKPRTFAAAMSSSAGDGAAYDVEEDRRVRKEQHRIGLAEFKPCGLCRHEFRSENLPYEISFKAVLEQRACWGITSLRLSDVKAGNLYDKHRLCSFCAQFFDIKSCVDQRRLLEGGSSHTRREHGLGTKHPSEAEEYESVMIRRLLRLPERESRGAFRQRIREYRAESIREIAEKRDAFQQWRRPKTAEPMQSASLTSNGSGGEFTSSRSPSPAGGAGKARLSLRPRTALVVDAEEAADQRREPGVVHECMPPQAETAAGSDDCPGGTDTTAVNQDEDENDDEEFLDADELMQTLNSGRQHIHRQEAEDAALAAKRERDAAEAAEIERRVREDARRNAEREKRNQRSRTALTNSFLLLQKSTRQKLDAIASAEKMLAAAEKLEAVDELVAGAIEAAEGSGGSGPHQRGGEESVLSSLRRIRAERTASQEYYLERRRLRLEMERTAALPMEKAKNGDLSRFAMYRRLNR